MTRPSRRTDRRESTSLPELTVAVATYRRPERLARLFDALAAQTVGQRRLQLVVVDDASGDNTETVLRMLASTSPIPTTIVSRTVNGGPAAARNDAWQAATGPLIAFTDDDCVPAPGWAAALLDAAGVDGPVIVVGRTIPDPAQAHRDGPLSRTVRSDGDRYLQTCNIAYRRADLMAVDGFDERLRTGEDLDLGLRVKALGAAVRVTPDALVHHDVRPASAVATVRESLRWVDLPLVVRKHPELRRTHLHLRLFWKSSHPWALLLLAAFAGGRRHPSLRLAAGLPWLAARRRAGIAPADLPGRLAADLAEVATMVAGSLKHRTLVL